MQRPPIVVRSGQLYLAAFLLNLVGWGVAWSGIAQRLAANPATVRVGWVLPASLVVWVAIWVALWWAVMARGSNVARWLVALLAGWSLVRLMLNLPAMLHGYIGVPEGALAAVAAMLHVAAAALLFRPEAREWFETKKEAA